MGYDKKNTPVTNTISRDHPMNHVWDRVGQDSHKLPIRINIFSLTDLTLCSALRFGDISLQERINQKNFETLEAYYKSLSEKVPLECKCTTLKSFLLKKHLHLVQKTVLTCFFCVGE